MSDNEPTNPSLPAIFRSTLKFINKADSQGLTEISEPAVYAKDQLIVDSGSSKRSLYLITSGSARVVRSHLGQDIAVARVGVGELVGEVSYLLHNASSSRIIADEQCGVSLIREESLQALLMSEPGMGSRFYQSLAARLAWKLRDTSQQIPMLALDEVAANMGARDAPGGKRTTRPGVVSENAVPASLVASVTAFKEAMLMLDQGLLKKKLDAVSAKPGVAQAMQALSDTMQAQVEAERNLEKEIGLYAFRETFPYLMTSHFNDLVYSKPRGYAGDYYMIDTIYGNQPVGSGRLGALVDEWLLQHSCSQAVRNRRELLRGAILNARKEYTGANGVPVTSLACGPARELVDVFTMNSDIAISGTCVDIDHDALAHAGKLVSAAGAGDRVRFVQDNIIKLAAGKGKTSIAPQQLIYSVGLTDYLAESYVISLLNWVHDNLLDGGQVVIGNFASTNPGKAYMDHLMDWKLIHRSPEQMREIFAKSKFGTAGVDVRTEAAGINLFAFARKV